jgi:uncharacterized membrane-anchored protein YhcB (DUF1043 family)
LTDKVVFLDDIINDPQKAKQSLEVSSADQIKLDLKLKQNRYSHLILESDRDKNRRRMEALQKSPHRVAAPEARRARRSCWRATTRRTWPT